MSEKRGNDQIKLEKMLQSGQLKPGTGLQHVAVMHDDWCKLLNKKGLCDCDPIIKVMGGPAVIWNN